MQKFGLMPLCIRSIFTSSHRDVQRLDPRVKRSARGNGQHPMAQTLRLQGKSVPFITCRTQTPPRSAHSRCHVPSSLSRVQVLLMLSHHSPTSSTPPNNSQEIPETSWVPSLPSLAPSNLPGPTLQYLQCSQHPHNTPAHPGNHRDLELECKHPPCKHPRCQQAAAHVHGLLPEARGRRGHQPAVAQQIPQPCRQRQAQPFQRRVPPAGCNL